MHKRTLAREIALQALYQHDLRREDEPEPAGDIDAFIEGATGDPEVREYARLLVDGAVRELDALDARIARAAEHWKVSRMAPVDRCILRIAILEILESQDVPPKVAINEAVDLAKKFSTEQSGAFVNGVLDRIYGELDAQDP